MKRLKNVRRLINRHPLLAASLLVAFLLVAYYSNRSTTPPVTPPATSFTQLLTRIDTGKVKSLDYDPGSYAVKVHEAGRPVYSIGVFGHAGESQLLNVAAAHKVNVSAQPLRLNVSWLDRLFALLPTLLVILVVLYLVKNMSPLRKGKLEPVTSAVSFKDIAGVDEAVEELAEIRDFLANPKRYEDLGAKVPKGILLYGPPGTGKTLLAKAVAHEADVPFYSISGSEFVEMFAGLGAARVRSLFKKAKESAPSIIFIDELDAVGRARSAGGSGSERESDQTLNQLLTEMDGFEIREHPIIVMAASNRLDVLDKALLRPGRFDRHISVDAPDRFGRLEIIELHSQGKRMGADVDLETIAIQTSGMTGADLANLMNEAALHAARRNATEIAQQDVEDAFMRIAAGAKKRHRSFSDHERRVVAYHEAGHAIVSERLGMKDKVHKISILPRGQSGGQTLYVSEEDVFLYGKQELFYRLSALLGGRAAEEMVFDEVTSGAADDLKRASEIARRMITELGMGDSSSLLVQEEGHQASPAERAASDSEARRILQERYAEAQRLLEAETKALTRVAEALLDEETLTRSRFLELLENTGEKALSDTALDNSVLDDSVLEPAAVKPADAPEA